MTRPYPVCRRCGCSLLDSEIPLGHHTLCTPRVSRNPRVAKRATCEIGEWPTVEESRAGCAKALGAAYRLESEFWKRRGPRDIPPLTAAGGG